MDGQLIGFLSMGIPLGIGLFLLTFKVGRWNGKMSTKIDNLTGKIETFQGRLDTFDKRCDGRMSEMHRRIDGVGKEL